MTEHTFSWKHLPSLFKETYKEWNNGDPWRQSAVVAYYAIFSLPALLIITITIAGSIFGDAAVQGRLSSEISAMIGPDAAKEVETMISNSYLQQNSVIATIIGVATLIFGATGVFYQLQQSLNNVWEVEPDQSAGIKKLVKDRVSSFGIVLVIGFLLLISLTLTTVLSVLSDFIKDNLPSYLLYVFFIANFIISFGIITLLFGMIYKILPDVDIEWKTVWIGAIVTSILFVIGKFGLSFYFGKANPGSAYGAAGSLILILLWTSYSCLILFFGAEFTQVYARRYGHKIQPSSHATKKENCDVPASNNQGNSRRKVNNSTQSNRASSSKQESGSKGKNDHKDHKQKNSEVIHVKRSDLRNR